MYASIPSPFEAKGMVSIIYVFGYTTRNILLQSKCNWILCFFRFYFRPTYPNFIKTPLRHAQNKIENQEIYGQKKWFWPQCAIGYQIVPLGRLPLGIWRD